MRWGSFGGALGALFGSCVALWGSFGGLLEVLGAPFGAPWGHFGGQWGCNRGPWVLLEATCRVVPSRGRSRVDFRDFPGNFGWPFGTILVPFSVHVSIQNGDENLIDFFVDFVSILGPFLVHVLMLF